MQTKEDFLKSLPGSGALALAEQILKENGVEPDEAPTVMQAIGYALLDAELYPEAKAGTVETVLYLCYVVAGPGKEDFFDAPVVRFPLVVADVNKALAWYHEHMNYDLLEYSWVSDDDLVTELHDQGIDRVFIEHGSHRLIEEIFVKAIRLSGYMTDHNSVFITLGYVSEQGRDKNVPIGRLTDIQLLNGGHSLKLWLNKVSHRLPGMYFTSQSEQLLKSGTDWWKKNICFDCTDTPNGINASRHRTIYLIPFEIFFPEPFHEGDLLICKPAEEKRKPDNTDFEVYAKVVLVSGNGETVVLQRYLKQGRLQTRSARLQAWQVRQLYKKMNEAEEAEFKKNCKEKNDGK